MPPEAVVRLVDHHEGRGTIARPQRSARAGELSPYPGGWNAGAPHPQGLPLIFSTIKGIRAVAFARFVGTFTSYWDGGSFFDIDLPPKEAPRVGIFREPPSTASDYIDRIAHRAQIALNTSANRSIFRANRRHQE